MMSRSGAGQLRAENRAIATGNSLAMISMMAWAAGFPASEILLRNWDPLALIAARFALGAGFLVPLWFFIEGRQRIVRTNWRLGLWVGAISFGLGAYLLTLAQYLTDPVTVAVIASAMPMAATLIEVVRGTRRLCVNFALGMGLSVLGAVVATGAGGIDLFGQGGAALLRLVFLFAWGSDMAVRRLPDVSPVGRATLTLSGGMVACSLAVLVLLLAGIDVLPAHRIGLREVTMLAIYAFAAMSLSQLLWIASVAKLGVAVASFHVNVTPFYVMILMLALGADWNNLQAVGAAIVIAGVVVAQRKPRAVMGTQAESLG